MADKNGWRLAVPGHRVTGRDQICWVCGERCVGKAPFTIFQSGKMKLQHPDSTSGQGACQASARQAVVAAACKAVGEYGPTLRLPFRQFQSALKPVASRSVKFERLCSHKSISLVLA